MRDELLWLALGAAIGNQRLLARLLADVPPEAFPPGWARQVARALADGKAREALARLGLDQRDGQAAADALIDHARRRGEKGRAVETADRLRAAAQVMQPLDFAAYARAQVAALGGAAEANGKAHTNGAASSGGRVPDAG